MLSVSSTMLFFGWMSASPILLKQILGLAYAIIKEKSSLPILIPFLLSIISFFLLMIQDTNAFTISFATITKCWPLLLLEDLWTIPLMMMVALTPLDFMKSSSIELAPFYLHQMILLYGLSFIIMTLPKLWIIIWPIMTIAQAS